MSERRACKAIGCCRMIMRYQTTRPDEAGLRQQSPRNVVVSAIDACMCCSRGRLSGQPQEAVPALPGREARGAPPWRPQAGDRGPGADDRADGAKRPLVARLRVGSTH
jgi:putative transposase